MNSCADCGRGVNSQGSNRHGVPLCIWCFDERNRKWTKRTIISAIRKFERKYGYPPAMRDWNPSAALRDGRRDLAERFCEDGCWPSSALVYRPGAPFSRWSEAIEAAGFTPRKVGGRGKTSEFAKAHPGCSL